MIIKNGLYTIYILINKVNNKIYVGTTKKSLSQRFRKGKGYQHQSLIYKDILKYGWDSFDHDIFASNLTEEEAFNMEKLLILKLHEQCPDMLYNRDSGGKHGKHCQKTKEIIRKANIGRVVSEETKTKLRKVRANQVFSKESLLKRSEKMKGRKMPPEFCKRIGETHSKKVKCVETGKIYSSLTAASKDLNVSVSGISQQIKGIYSHVKGFHFEYV